jgi:mRNA-degrading endonuclease toxin of MazEF toxin-antitoxin module
LSAFVAAHELSARERVTIERLFEILSGLSVQAQWRSIDRVDLEEVSMGPVSCRWTRAAVPVATEAVPQRFSVYNARARLAMACPITSHAKGYPFEVALSAGSVTGVILADHLKSVDWKERRAEFAGTVPGQVLADVRARIRPLLGL